MQNLLFTKLPEQEISTKYRSKNPSRSNSCSDAGYMIGSLRVPQFLAKQEKQNSPALNDAAIDTVMDSSLQLFSSIM